MFKRFLIAIIIVIVCALGWYFEATRAVTNEKLPSVEFQVKAGDGIDKISQNLSAQKLIRSRTAFKITVIRLGITNKIQAGYFQLSPNMAMGEIALKLTRATAKEVRVTIQEGLRRQEIANLLFTAFQNINPGTVFDPNAFVVKTKDLEGQLFPDTYQFDPKTDTDSVISRLHDKYIQVTGDLQIPSNKLQEVTILASLLEREAANATEMPDVAGVFENRLNAGWPLQVDATVQYAIATTRCKKLDCDWWPKNLTPSDLKIKSPFNTYLNPGLPPTPISNPGRDSLKAAFKPAKNSYWFYLHDNTGQIHFANTIEEHNRNICTYLKKSCP